MNSRTIGTSPGSLEFLGVKRVEKVTMRLTEYDSQSLEVTPNFKIENLGDLDPEKNYWLEVSGIHDTEAIAAICKKLDIHALVLESILDTSSQPTFDDLGDSLFTEVKVPVTVGGVTNIEQVSILLKKGMMITFVEGELDFLAPIQKRLLQVGARIRIKGLDYLKWTVLDLVTDHSLFHIDKMEIQLEELETLITDEKNMPDLALIHNKRREVAEVYRSIRPFRDIAKTLSHCDSELLTDQSSAYYNDLYSHAIQAVEVCEFLREHAASLRELYFTMTSHHLNEVMKVLAGISVIFLPLSFLAGVYGMNFDHIPELHWPWGYQCLLAVFFVIALSLFIVFKRKKWF